METTGNLRRYSQRAMESPFWNELAETMPRDRLDHLHLIRLKKLIRYVYDNSAFYQRRFKEIGLEPTDICSLEDYRTKVPLTDKDDFLQMQEDQPPYGLTQAMPAEFIAHHAETSGTTGVPLAIPYSLYDTVRYGESWCPAFWATGIRPSDSFYFAFGWGNFAGFWSAYWGVSKVYGLRYFVASKLSKKSNLIGKS